MTDRQMDRQMDGQTDRRPGKNNMSPDPKGVDIIIIILLVSLYNSEIKMVCKKMKQTLIAL